MAATKVANNEQLTDEDRVVYKDGANAYANNLSLDDNPHGPELAAPDARLALIWRKGYLDCVYSEGRVDARDGKPRDSNPYVDASEDGSDPDDYCTAWLEGWQSWHDDLLVAAKNSEADKPISDYLNELEAECQAAMSQWQGAKEEASAAKKLYEAAVLRLRGAVRQLKSGGEPLFEQPKPNEQAATNEATNHAWRKFGIDRLGLTAKINEKLADADVLTIGDLEDLRGCKGLRSVPGIGQATVDKIEDALIAWLSENRDSAALQDAA